MARKKFDLRKSPVDGMIRRWERRKASLVLDLSTGGPILTEDEIDHDVWIVTGVFRRRKDVFASMSGAA